MAASRITQTGAIELPTELRQRLGLLEGDEVLFEEHEGGIFLRPAIGNEMWTQVEIAGYLLNCSVTKEDYDKACEEVRKMGFDPATVPYTDPDMREKLLTGAEFTARMDTLNRRATEPERASA